MFYISEIQYTAPAELIQEKLGVKIGGATVFSVYLLVCEYYIQSLRDNDWVKYPIVVIKINYR